MVDPSAASWLSVSPGTGGNGATLTVSVDANSGASRSGTVTLSAGSAAPVTLTVTQAAQASACSSFVTACAWGFAPVVVSPVGKDPHYLVFTAPVSGQIVIQSSARATTADPYAVLYNASQVQLAADDNTAGDRNFKITYTVTAGQTYYLAASHFSAARSGSYTVSAQ